MTLQDFRDKYGDRVLGLAVSEVVRQGLAAAAANDQSGRPMELTVAAIASDLSNQDWNVVRFIIKRSL